MRRGVRDFVENQKSDGELESGGEFTLNPEAALEKLARFGLDSPEKAILRLIQFAVKSEPSKLKVLLGRDSLELHVRYRETVPELGLDGEISYRNDSLPLLLLSCLHSGYEGGWICHYESGWKLGPGVLTHSSRRSQHPCSVEIGLRRQAPEGFWERLRSLLRWRCLSARHLQSSLGFCPYHVSLDGIGPETWGPQGKCLLEVFLTAPRSERPAGLRKASIRPSHRVMVGKRRVKHSNPNWDSFHIHHVGAIARLFGSSSNRAWRADARDKATVLAHFWLPLSRFTKPSITFVRHGVIVGQTVWDFPLPLCGVISSVGLDHDLSGLEVVDNGHAQEVKNILIDQLGARLLLVARDRELPDDLKRRLEKAGIDIPGAAEDRSTHPILREKSDKNKHKRHHQEFAKSRLQQDRNKFRTQRRQLRDRS